jgi:predicted CopG family antitoxin
MKPRFIGFEVEEEVYEILRKLAYERNTTLSCIARELLMRALRQLNLAQRSGGSAAGSELVADPLPGSKIDPVVLADIEDLEEELSVLEKIVSGVESNLLKIGNPSGPIYGAIVRQQLEKLDEAESRLRRIRQAYYRLRRQGRGDERLAGLASRIYSLNKRVKGLREKWRRR